MSNTTDNNSEIRPQVPVTPIDMMMAQANAWLEDIEKQLDEVRHREPSAPDDIPTFVTRQS